MDLRGSLETIGLDVPAGFTKDMVAGGCQTRESRHLSSGNEPHGSIPGKVEKLQHPFGGDFLDDRCSRGYGVQAGVLVPGRGEELGSV
jgi:hypothetical protein